MSILIENYERYVEIYKELEDLCFSLTYDSIEKVKKLMVEIDNKFLIRLILKVFFIRELNYKILGDLFALIPIDDYVINEVENCLSCHHFHEVSPYSYLYLRGIIKKLDDYRIISSDGSIDCYEHPIPENTVQYFMFYDDIQGFLNFCTVNAIDFNQKLEIKVNSFYCDSIYSFIFHYASINILKYFILNGFEIEQKYATIAIQSGNIEFIEFLISRSLSFDNTIDIAVNYHYNTIAKWIYENFRNQISLPFCVTHFNTDFLFYLIEQGNYDIDYRIGNETCTDIAVTNRNIPLFIYLVEKCNASLSIERYYFETVLHKFCKSGELELVKYACNKGSPVEALDCKRRSPVFIAATYNHLDIVKYLVSLGVNLNKKAIASDPILYPVMTNDNVELIDFLCRQKININDENEEGYTALHKAAKKGYFEIVKCLLKYGADINHRAYIDNDKTPLDCSIQKGNIQIVKYLIEHGAKYNKKDPNGTLLHSACRCGDLPIVKYLCSLGFDPASRDKSGKTAFLYSAGSSLSVFKYLYENGCKKLLYRTQYSSFFFLDMAIKKDRLDVCDFLLSLGINIDSRTRNNATPLLSLSYTSIPLFDERIRTKYLYLLEHGADVNVRYKKNRCTPLIYSIIKQPIECIKLLIENGADINTEDDLGYSPLLYACKRGSSNIIQYLCDLGADVYKCANDGSSVLHCLFNYQHKEEECFTSMDQIYDYYSGMVSIANYFIEQKRVNVNLQDKNGVTPLHLLVKFYFHHPTLFHNFISVSGLDVNVGDNNGNTPLFYWELDEPFEALILNGADINHKNKNGLKPFHYYCMCGYFLQASYLVHHGYADIHEPTENGMLPIHYAACNQNFKLFKYLYNKGCSDDIEKKDNLGKTPLHYACENGNLVIIQFLIDKGASPAVVDNKNRTPLSLANSSNRKQIASILNVNEYSCCHIA